MDEIALKERILFTTPFHSGIRCKPFEFDYDGSSMSDAMERLDFVMFDSMHRLKDSLQSDAVFSLGISGGFDSRIVLHYAKKVGMNLKLFFFGESHPHRVLAGRDYKNALLVGKKYSVGKDDIAVFGRQGDVVNNFLYDCRNYPGLNPNMNVIGGTSHLMRGYFFDNVDVCLSGVMGGEAMGSCIPVGKPADVVKYVVSRLSFADGIEWWLPGFLPQESIGKLQDFFSRFDDDYVTGIYSYLYNFHIRDVYGEPGMIYDALSKCSFSPFYTKEFINEMKHWNPDWIKNHVLQKSFHMHVVPGLCGITNQRWAVPFRYQGTVVERPARILLMGMFGLRWFGMEYHKWGQELLKTKFAVDVLLKDDFLYRGDSILEMHKSKSILGCNILKAKYVGW